MCTVSDKEIDDDSGFGPERREREGGCIEDVDRRQSARNLARAMG